MIRNYALAFALLAFYVLNASAEAREPKQACVHARWIPVAMGGPQSKALYACEVTQADGQIELVYGIAESKCRGLNTCKIVPATKSSVDKPMVR
jgi:hypothetical protein